MMQSGEAYDKAARALGFPYPGGVHMDQAAQNGDPDHYRPPRPKVTETLRISAFRTEKPR